VAKCGVCQQIKVKHQKSGRPLQSFLIPSGNGKILLWTLCQVWQGKRREMMQSGL
jgi:hypothetical protein